MIYDSMTNGEYHALEAISSSAVKTISKQSIAHWLGQERKETPAMAMGTAIHSLTLEPEKAEVVRGPENRRGKSWGEAVDAAKAFSPDAVVLPEAEFDKVQEIADAARAHPLMRNYLALEDSRVEMSIVVDDPDYGFQLRARPDLYNSGSGMIIDLKSTLDASPRGFAKSAHGFGYFVQAAFYKRVLQLEGLPVEDFVFLAVEKDPPYATCAHLMSGEGMAYGEVVMHKALAAIAEYKSTGVISTGWPDTAILNPPTWANEVFGE